MYGAGYFLTRNATCYPNRKAVVFNDREFTYRELNTRVNCLANNLMAIGIKKGDSVGYIMYNCDQVVTLFFAIQKIGAVAVPINFRLLPAENKRNLDFAECKALVYGDQFTETAGLAKVNSPFLKIFIRCGGSSPLPLNELDLDALCETGECKEPGIDIEEKDRSVILFTSGSTGVPKGVIRTHRIARDYATMFASENTSPKEKHEIFLTHSPHFHTAGLGILMKSMALAGTFITVHGADPVQILGLIDRHRVTQILILPPVLYMRLARVDGLEKYDLTSVVEAQTTGGGNSMDYVEAMFRLFPNCKIRTSYGSTEVGASTSIVLSKEEVAANPARIFSSGKISNFTEMRLVNDNGQDVECGEIGEAIVRSTFILEGYLKQPELTRQAIRDGWYYTNDLLYQDKDGFYYLVDRKNDMIKTGGENVYPQEVEVVLRTCPEIEDCAVVGIPDKKFGEAVAAAIVVKKGQRITAEKLIAFCRANMASYKKPRYIGFLDELPVNGSNKIQKSVLRERAQEIFKQIAE